MIRLTEIRVSTFPNNHNLITWGVDFTTENLNNYRLSFYRSEAQTHFLEDYTLVGSNVNPFLDFTFEDHTVSGMTNKFTDQFYIIQVSGIVPPYAVASQGPYTSLPLGPMDYVSREINRRKSIVINQYSSQEYILLKRKTTGAPCPVHYDDTLQRTTISHCLQCYDTGFDGGFYSPIEVSAQINEGPTRSQIQVWGNWQDQDSILTILNAPLLVPRDIIVDELNRRWEIITVRSYNKALFIQEQAAQMRQIERGDVIYSYPLEINDTGFIYNTNLRPA